MSEILAKIPKNDRFVELDVDDSFVLVKKEMHDAGVKQEEERVDRGQQRRDDRGR